MSPRRPLIPAPDSDDSDFEEIGGLIGGLPPYRNGLPPVRTQVIVRVVPWAIALHDNKNGKMGGYIMFKCTVNGVDGFMGTNVTWTSKGQWTFNTSSGGQVDVNMLPETNVNFTYVKKYIAHAARNGAHYMTNGNLNFSDSETPSAVTTLIVGMGEIAHNRFSNGQPDVGLRHSLMRQFNLYDWLQERRGKDFVPPLGNIEWAFAPAEAWAQFARGEARRVKNE